MAGAIISGMSLVTALAGIMAARPAVAATAEEKIDYLIDLQALTTQQLQRLIEIGEGLIGLTTITITPEISPVVVTIPADPEAVDRVLQSARRTGDVEFFTLKLTFAALAGVTTTVTYPIVPNFVAIERRNLMSSDRYDPNILLNVWVDGRLATPFGVALTGLTAVDFGQFWVKHRDITYSVANGTAFNIVVSLEVQACIMEKTLFDRWYAPLQDFIFRKLTEAVGVEP